MEEEYDVERRLLEASCLESGIDAELIQLLVKLERDNERRLRRRGLFTALRSAIEEHLTETEIDTASG